MPRTKNLHPNVAAFLDMLAVSEGTAGLGDDGYNVGFGWVLFSGYEDHPRVRAPFVVKGKKNYTTAAGRYQTLAWVFDAYKKTLKLTGFTPEEQDAIALQQIKERRGAIRDIEAGQFETAIKKVRTLWASLPGAGYGQHENALSKVKTAYLSAGGKIIKEVLA
jgi:muramidase (phage lysozyme)